MDSTLPPPDRLLELLEPVAIEREVGGNQPLPLDAVDQAWLVVRGVVEVFAVGNAGAAANGVGGARTHVATLRRGHLFLSVGQPRRRFGGPAEDGESPSARLLAVPHPGTRLYETSTSALTRLAHELEDLEQLEQAVEGWVRHLFERLPRNAVPQRFVGLPSGAEIALDGEGEVARSSGGVVWVRHVEGSSRFLGRRELTSRSNDPPLPLSDATWLTGTGGKTVLSGVATGHLLQSGVLWEGLRHFHDLFVRYVGQRVAAAVEEEGRRLAHRAELDDRTIGSAHAELVSVLDGRSREEGESTPAWDTEGPDPTLTACRWVAQRLDLRLSPPTGPPATDPGIQVRQISDASRVRHRKVLLRGRWWRRTNGPLLAFREEDVVVPASGDTPEWTYKKQHPVALLPTSPTRYELLDPRTENRRSVDSRVAEQLGADGYMFYRPLPERPLRARDLVTLALSDCRRDLWTVLAMGLGGGSLSLLVPLATDQFFGRIIPSADRSQLVQMTLALVLAAIGTLAFQVTRSIAVLRLGGKIEGSLQAAVWDRLLALPSRFFRRYTVGDLSARVMGVDTMREIVLGQVSTSFLGLIFSFFSFSLLFYYSIQLAILASVLVLLLVLVTTWVAYLQIRHQRALLRLEGRIASLVLGFIRGVGKLRTGGAEKRAYAIWARRFGEQRQQTFIVRRLANLQATFNAVFDICTVLALFAMMGHAMKSELPVSRFLAFSAAFGQVQATALTFVALVSSLLAIVPLYERLKPILEEAPEVDDSKIESDDLSGEVELRHVFFRYAQDGPLILNDVSISARPGQMIALVGPSGSGKSTLLRLLLGFERPISGSIYYDGQDLQGLNLQSVRRQIGVVLQNGQPMSGDLFSNIVGGSNLGIDDAWRAARMAGLAEDIEALPMGMHTIISEGGTTFSGGQVQRLMIARAVVRRPRLVFFDEATSALDNRSQEVVIRSLDSLKATRIVVAHRLSTIRNADRIYVIDGGQVVEAGSFDALMEQDGVFARLAERQTA